MCYNIFHNMISTIFALAFGLLLLGCVKESTLPDKPAPTQLAVREIVGAPAKAVWIRDMGGGEDLHQKGTNHALIAFDTEVGERVLLVPNDQINKPLISPDGSYIVFSRRRDDSIHRIAWTGGVPAKIGTGFALAIWRDPTTGEDWLYKAVDRSRNGDAPYQRIVRHPVADPKRVEDVWRGGDVSLDSVHISRDGTRLGGMFPWPRGMIVDTRTGEATVLGRGCWTSLSPDNSYLLWIFDGAHRNLFFHTADGQRRWRVPINTIPGGEGRKMYHPRWSNHARFMIASGPYNTEGGRLSVRGAAHQVEIWIGRFDERFTRVEAWARLTDNTVGDYTPDLWVAGGATSEIPATVAGTVTRDVPAPSLSNAWPGTTDGLVFLWSHANAANQVPGPDGSPIPCDVEAQRGGRWTPSYGMDIRNGSFVAPDAGPRIVAACRRSNELAIEATLLPRSGALSGPARIIALSQRIGNANFVLGQDEDWLVFRLRTPETGRDGTANDSQVAITPLPVGRRVHVIVTYRDGELSAYIDGKPARVQQRIQGGFDTWEDAVLRFGDEASFDRTWDGEIDGVAILNRFVGAEEASRRYELNARRIGQRAIPETFEVRARLVASTPTPHPNDIAPYRRALALCEYELDPAEPPIEGSRRIQVYHWVILDGDVVPDAVPPAGVPVVLRIQRTEEHPQLEAERRLIGIDAIDLPEFVDVSR